LDHTSGQSETHTPQWPFRIAALKRVALNAVRIVTGKNSIRHTMRDAVLDVRVLADILNHMPVA